MEISYMLFFILLMCGKIYSVEFPGDIQRCEVGDEKCIQDTINDVVFNNPGGHKGLNVTSLDPLFVKEVLIDQGNINNPVHISLHLKNLQLTGLKNHRVTQMTGWNSDAEAIKEMKGTCPVITITGDYEVTGQVLLLPITGKGKCKLSFDNWDAVWKISGKLVKKNNEDYLRVVKHKLTFKTSRLHMYFENLFNGDKALSDNMNAFLDNNWRDILQEIKPQISKSISGILVNVLSGTLSAIPYKNLFLSE